MNYNVGLMKMELSRNADTLSKCRAVLLAKITGKKWGNKIMETNEQYALHVYKVNDSDSWPVVETIVRSTPEACECIAETHYNGDEYHWTNATKCWGDQNHD